MNIIVTSKMKDENTIRNYFCPSCYIQIGIRCNDDDFIKLDKCPGCNEDLDWKEEPQYDRRPLHGVPLTNDPESVRLRTRIS